MGSFCAKPAAAPPLSVKVKSRHDSKALPSKNNEVKNALSGKKKSHTHQEIEGMLNGAKRIDEFCVMNTIGTGSYGAVKLCRHKATDTMLACKVTHKNHAAKGDETKSHESVAWKQLQGVRSHFVVRMYADFVEGGDICTMMELVEGGDLHIHLEMNGCFTPPDAKFYIAEICLGLQAIHGAQIIYHDLKPQNMILSKSGHIKLIDFGLASIKSPGQRNCCHCMCGAPAYMAPEMYHGTGHDEAVDWWAVGVTYYEFLTGLRPFGGGTVDAMKREVCYCDLGFEGLNIPREAKDCIVKFLEKDPANRLGSRGGIEQIKKHAAFASVKWDRIKNCKEKTPARNTQASMKGCGGSDMTRMDKALMAAGGNKKGERRFTISEGKAKTAKKDNPSEGERRGAHFAAARERAEMRHSSGI